MVRGVTISKSTWLMAFALGMVTTVVVKRFRPSRGAKPPAPSSEPMRTLAPQPRDRMRNRGPTPVNRGAQDYGAHSTCVSAEVTDDVGVSPAARARANRTSTARRASSAIAAVSWFA